MLAVGEKWDGALISEGAVFELRDDGAYILMFFDGPTENEIKDVRAGRVEVGYYIVDSVIFILAKYGYQPWFDMPFNIQRYTKMPNSDYAFEENEGLSIITIMIDSRTREIKVLRMFTAGHEFSVGLVREIQKQKEKEYEEAAYQNTISETYSRLMPDAIAERAKARFTLKQKY